jgi:hypothetical protein
LSVKENIYKYFKNVIRSGVYLDGKNMCAVLEEETGKISLKCSAT